ENITTINRHATRGRAYVTAPLIGTDTTFSEGEQGEIEREMLNEVNVSRSDFDLPEPYFSSGTRRPMLVRTSISLTFDPLVLSFSLPKGCYATVVTREFMKRSPLQY
ncbi:MAG: tRNA pseudouridine(13) synthase TruD, partial [Halobacteriaceae archaeon]